MSIILNGHDFITWADVEKEIFTPEEIAESDLKVSIIGEIIKAIQEGGITLQEFEQRSGVSQSVIARMRSGNMNVQLDTVLKVLAATGKTLTVVPISDNEQSEPQIRGLN